MVPDPKTIFLVLTMGSGFLALAQIFYLLTRRTYPGFGLWSLAVLAMFLGYLLMSLRAAMPLWVSVQAGNTAFVLAAVLALIGTCRFLGLSPPGAKVWLAPLVSLAATSFFFWVYDNAVLRGLSMSLVLAVVGLPVAWLMVRHAPKGGRPTYLGTALLVALLCLALPLRSALLLIAAPQSSLFTPYFVNTWYLLIAVFCQMGWTIGFVMMNDQRLEQDLRRSRAELRSTIDDLQRARREVKQLGGLLPICANCKKIRDDTGYWNQLESYIKKHSEARFTHSLCPDCAKELYPEIKIPEYENAGTEGGETT